MKPVSEEHEELYHYTTAIGLEGILRTQQLWATHMSYLNDAEEHTGFFVHRLPKLLEIPCSEAVAELMKTSGGRKAITSKEVGGPKRAVEDFKKQMAEYARQVTLDLNEPYVLSFCSGNAHGTPNDGLLSQWRGYGTDGGYAVVFETAKLSVALTDYEVPAFDYQFGNFSDVDYVSAEGLVVTEHWERRAWESSIQKRIKEFLMSPSRDKLDLHTEISALSCRYKHPGFSEEKEVRVVVMPSNDKVRAVSLKLAEKKGGTVNPRKPVKYRERGGLLIPYVGLFGESLCGPAGKLPIRRILVGPHVDREKRAAAVRSILKQYGMSIPVEVSGIPYLGR